MKLRKNCKVPTDLAITPKISAGNTGPSTRDSQNPQKAIGLLADKIG